MDNRARQYLEAQVMTATPQKLRLMLIEGAIRFARQTIQQWAVNQNEEALESLIRCRSIVSELLAGVRTEESDLTRQVASVYVFLFRTLTEAQLRRDRQKVEEVIRVLEVECETWRLVCEKLPGKPFTADSKQPHRSSAPITLTPHGNSQTACAFEVDA